MGRRWAVAVTYECGQASAYRSVHDPTWGRVKAVTPPGRRRQRVHRERLLHGGRLRLLRGGGHAPPAVVPDRLRRLLQLRPGGLAHRGAQHRVQQARGRGLHEVLAPGPVAGRGPGRQLQPVHPGLLAPAALADNGRTNSASSYFVEALYEAGAEVVLTGHEHLYERFAPQTPSGVANPNGIRQFIVGTGGKSRHGLSRTPPGNAEARTASAYGVLTLTLHPDSYDWRFVPEAGRTFTDSGSHPCH
jgi:hypothetical protein